MDALTQAKKALLDDQGLDENTLAQALNTLASRKIDFGDLFFQRVISESFSLEEGIVKGGSYDIERGVGVRAVVGEKTGFAYSDIIDEKSLLDACKAARCITLGHECQREHILHYKDAQALYVGDNPIELYPREQKVSILEKLDKIARSLDKRVVQVMAGLRGEHSIKLIATTEGKLCADAKPIVQLSVTVIMQDGERREYGNASCGGALLFGDLITEKKVYDLAFEAVRMAQVNMQAIEAPAGTMEVVLGAGWPGVLVHEAVGHGLEGDFNRTGSSAFTGKIGQKVASSACTVIDDGSIKNRRGSLSIDDEGTCGQQNILIENGILKGYMQDRQNAMLMGTKPSGNGRRESYSYLPLPRMTNTYLMPGQFSKDEIISSVKKGLYAVNFAGGQVDITSGRFVFSASEAYLIEDGKITTPVKGATLIGNGPETMCKVSMVGSDLEFDKGIGACGKAGQSVPVGIGQPTVKVDSLTVGGTNVA